MDGAAAALRPESQKELSLMAAKGSRKALLASVLLPARALFRDGGGPGAGAFLRPASDHGHVIADAAFAPFVRRRLLLPDPGTTGLQLRPYSTRTGRVCGLPIVRDLGAQRFQNVLKYSFLTKPYLKYGLQPNVI